MRLRAPHPKDGLFSAPCSIVALSAILGRNWQTLAKQCRDDGTLLPCGGMWHRDFLAILRRHGFTTEPVRGFSGKALKTWLRLPRDADELYVVGTKQHLAVVQGEMSVGIRNAWAVEPWRDAWDVNGRITGIDRIWK